MKHLLTLMLLYSTLFCSEKISIYYQNYLNNPADLQNLKKLAESYKESKNYNKAIKFYKICIEREPDEPFNYYKLALCYKIKGRPDLALDVITNALYYFENNLKLKLFHADLLLELGQISNSIKI